MAKEVWGLQVCSKGLGYYKIVGLLECKEFPSLYVCCEE
jgi:hypothetical protein